MGMKMVQWNFIIFAAVLLFDLGICQLVIEPQNAYATKGELFQMVCKSRVPINSCSWEINGNPFIYRQHGSPYESFDDLEMGECGIRTPKISEAENGLWTCRVSIINGKNSSIQQASTHVTILLSSSSTLTFDGSALAVTIMVVTAFQHIFSQ